MNPVNPFSIGDKVICHRDLTGTKCSTVVREQLSIKVKIAPERGEELVVDGLFRDMVQFRRYNTPTAILWWPHKAFVAAASINAEIDSLL